MSPLNHILVATDLSTSARNAAERAAYLSKEQQASLDLLYVANPAPFERLKQLVAPGDDLLKRVLDTAGEKFAHWLQCCSSAMTSPLACRSRTAR